MFSLYVKVLCDILSTGGLPGNGKGDQPSLYFAADDLEYQVCGVPVYHVSVQREYQILIFSLVS
jgi:hypothetical protein